MSTFSKFAVTTTLALGAWVGFIGIQVTSVGIHGSAKTLLKQNSPAILHLDHSTLDAYDSLQAKFEPDPTDPPNGTGGSGTR